MVEPHRLETPAPGGTADRDSRAERLLVDGLDRYFAGDYDRAIHLWTRVLFLDRSHARARAYIDRARTALAERQRRFDEMVHASGERLAEGRVAEARQLLTQAIGAGGEDERVAALRLQIERLERARHPAAGERPDTAALDAGQLKHAPSRWRVALVAVTGAAVGVLLALVATRPVILHWLGFTGARPELTPASAPAAAAQGSETELARAHTLFDRGRVSEALQ